MEGNMQKVLYISCVVIPVVVKYFFRRRHNLLIDEVWNKNCNTHYQNIFIHSKNCRQHIFDGIACDDECSLINLSTLVHYIKSAKESISLCILTLQLQDILRELINAHKQGLEVRIILDREMIAMDSYKFYTLKNAGIPMKTQKTDGSYLHHKFCLIDDKNEESAKMFFGSMNITMQGIVKNFEHITLTDDNQMIRRFSEEFEELWNEFI